MVVFDSVFTQPGSKADERRDRQEGPLLGVKQTKSGKKRTSALERRLSGVERTLWRTPWNVCL